MSNLENIQKAILAEAELEAQGILDQARERAEADLDQVRLEEGQALARQKAYATNKAASLKEQILAGARLEARDMLLACQQDLIDQVMDRAKTRLLQLSDEELSELIQEKLDQLELEVGQVLVLPEGRDLKLDSPLPQTFDPKLQVGFALEKSGVSVKFDFLEILEYSREDLEHLILNLVEGGR